MMVFIAAFSLATRSHFYAVRGTGTSSFDEGSQDDLTLPYPRDRCPRSHATSLKRFRLDWGPGPFL
jgi:hypothetical protein